MVDPVDEPPIILGIVAWIAGLPGKQRLESFEPFSGVYVALEHHSKAVEGGGCS